MRVHRLYFCFLRWVCVGILSALSFLWSLRWNCCKLSPKLSPSKLFLWCWIWNGTELSQSRFLFFLLGLSELQIISSRRLFGPHVTTTEGRIGFLIFCQGPRPRLSRNYPGLSSRRWRLSWTKRWISLMKSNRVIIKCYFLMAVHIINIFNILILSFFFCIWFILSHFLF